MKANKVRKSSFYCCVVYGDLQVPVDEETNVEGSQEYYYVSDQDYALWNAVVLDYCSCIDYFVEFFLSFIIDFVYFRIRSFFILSYQLFAFRGRLTKARILVLLVQLNKP